MDVLTLLFIISFSKCGYLEGSKHKHLIFSFISYISNVYLIEEYLSVDIYNFHSNNQRFIEMRK